MNFCLTKVRFLSGPAWDLKYKSIIDRRLVISKVTLVTLTSVEKHRVCAVLHGRS